VHRRRQRQTKTDAADHEVEEDKEDKEEVEEEDEKVEKEVEEEAAVDRAVVATTTTGTRLAALRRRIDSLASLICRRSPSQAGNCARH
jgi:hypothetical protein